MNHIPANRRAADVAFSLGDGLHPGSIADANDEAQSAEQGVSEQEVLKRGMEAKSKEFLEKSAEVQARV